MWKRAIMWRWVSSKDRLATASYVCKSLLWNFAFKCKCCSLFAQHSQSPASRNHKNIKQLRETTKVDQVIHVAHHSLRLGNMGMVPGHIIAPAFMRATQCQDSHTVVPMHHLIIPKSRSKSQEILSLLAWWEITLEDYFKSKAASLHINLTQTNKSVTGQLYHLTAILTWPTWPHILPYCYFYMLLELCKSRKRSVLVSPNKCCHYMHVEKINL